MYRKKNAVVKATDVRNCALAASEEHKIVSEIVSEASDWGASGYARLGGLYFVKLEDAHSAACMVYRQVEETHVADSAGSEGKWAHTTHISVYEND